MERGEDKTSNEFIGACTNATQNAPTYLSRRQTNDAIATLAKSTGNKIKKM